MPIHCAVTLDVAKPLGEVFAFLDDEAQAPKWLGRCADLKRTSPGEKAVGSTLVYTYKEAGRTGTMDGVVTAYEKDRRLGIKYTDRMMEVVIGFSFAPEGQGTRVEHTIDITPRGFMGRLLTPVIRSATRKQVARDTGVLKQLLDGR